MKNCTYIKEYCIANKKTNITRKLVIYLPIREKGHELAIGSWPP